jgi:hypothetical protein
VFREGSFVPTLSAELFEILVKHPAKFAVKHFALDGLRAEVFRDLVDILRAPGAHAPSSRNATILGVVRPLVRFVADLPQATLKTGALSTAALAVRRALLTAREPDTLLFAELPAACGVGRIGPDDPASDERREAFRVALQHSLRELQTFHEHRRKACKQIVADALGRSGSSVALRAELGARSRALRDRPVEHRLGAVVQAAASDTGSEDEWLEALLMVISDRPFRSWDDADADTFEAKASAFARRFAAFEAVHAALGIDGAEEVRHLAVTGHDGSPREQVVRFAPADREAARGVADDITSRLKALTPGQRAAAFVLLAENELTNLQSEHPESSAPALPTRDAVRSEAPRVGATPHHSTNVNHA